MKILIIEDRSPADKHIKMTIDSLGHIPTLCRSSDRFIEIIKSDTFTSNNYDCYILDLSCPTGNMDKNKDKKNTNHLITGWVLFVDYIIKYDKNALDKVIIFSDYIDYLRPHIEKLNDKNYEYEFLQYLENRKALIPKSLGFGALKNAINEREKVINIKIQEKL